MGPLLGRGAVFHLFSLLFTALGIMCVTMLNAVFHLFALLCTALGSICVAIPLKSTSPPPPP